MSWVTTRPNRPLGLATLFKHPCCIQIEHLPSNVDPLIVSVRRWRPPRFTPGLPTADLTDALPMRSFLIGGEMAAVVGTAIGGVGVTEQESSSWMALSFAPFAASSLTADTAVGGDWSPGDVCDADVDEAELIVEPMLSSRGRSVSTARCTSRARLRLTLLPILLKVEHG